MCNQAKYAKRLVFQTTEQLQEFLRTYLETEVSRHLKFTLVPLIRDVPLVGKALFQDVLLEPTNEVCVQAMTMRLLDDSLLDGMLRHWKGNLVRLEELEAVPA